METTLLVEVILKSLHQAKKQFQTAKEPTMKLYAAAAPFNPLMIPVFCSFVMPALKEHSGILLPPVNVPTDDN